MFENVDRFHDRFIFMQFLKTKTSGIQNITYGFKPYSGRCHFGCTGNAYIST